MKKKSVTSHSKKGQKKFRYDVAVSFAGEDRALAKELADHLRDYRLKVFFDDYVQPELIGKDLYSHLAAIYSNECLYCIVLISKNYLQKKWPYKVELPAAQERNLTDTEEYILPLLLDDTEVPGIGKTIGYVDIRTIMVKDAAKLIAKKVLKRLYSDPSSRLLLNEPPERRITRFRNLSLTDLDSFFCAKMYNCIAGEIRYLAITATRLLEDLQFRAAFEMLLEKKITEGRTITLRFYIMDPDSLALGKFAELSDESVESLKDRINRSYEILKSLSTEKMKNKILIRV
jgi:hypothetical protein